MGRRSSWFFLAVPCLLAASAAPAAEPDPEIALAEKTLKDAGVATDGPSLLEFFRKRTLPEEELRKLEATVRRLGDDEFQEREKASRQLVEAGRAAIPFLKAALRDPDLEIARRAERCLNDIELAPLTGVASAAALLTGEKRPDDAAAVLLAYLPFAEDEVIEDAVLRALARVGLRDGKPDPALAAALADKHLLRRVAAAHVLGLSPLEGERRPAVKLLEDPEPRVRYAAAAALARSGDRGAIPTVTALLTDAPLTLAWQAEELLCRVAGEQAPLLSLGTGEAAERRKCRDAWEAWWKANADKADLARLKQEEPLRGLTLVTEYDGNEGGRVWEFGPDGKMRWQIKGLNGPNDVQLLPGGRVLVAERNANRVTERDRDGKVLWQYAVPNQAIACQRLPGGDTLIASFTELMEVSPDGKKVHSLTHPSGFRHAIRLRNGHILYIASNGQVGELDASWKQVRLITPESYRDGAGYWASVEALPNGRYLLAMGSAGKVIEIDAEGKIHWQITVSNVVFASRLRNGNTLVSNFENRCLIEYDRTGKEVNRHTLAGRPFTFRRY